MDGSDAEDAFKNLQMNHYSAYLWKWIEHILKFAVAVGSRAMASGDSDDHLYQHHPGRHKNGGLPSPGCSGSLNLGRVDSGESGACWGGFESGCEARRPSAVTVCSENC